MTNIIPSKSRRGLLDSYMGFDDWFKRALHDLRIFDLKTNSYFELTPPLDISEDSKNITIIVEMPGLDTKDLDITLENGFLYIKGEKKLENDKSDKHFHRIERTYGNFCRSYRLPVEVKEDAIDATYKNGVLKITLPKIKESKPAVTHVEIH